MRRETGQRSQTIKGMKPKMKGRTMATDTGGPAYPRQADWQFQGTPDEKMVEAGAEGMTLLDWFAGQALTAKLDGRVKLLVERIRVGDDFVLPGDDVAGTELVARNCYIYAQAMLAEKRRLEKAHA